MSELPAPADLAGKIDHTLLKAEAIPDQIEALCDEAKRFGFVTVCVNPIFVRQASRRLDDCQTEVCSVVGFPLGATPTTNKADEAKRAIEDGAAEIDMVIHPGAMLAGQTAYVYGDIAAVAQTVHQYGSRYMLKVILECGLLSDEQIATACELAERAGADFVKTSTGTHPSGGATVEQVRVLRAKAGRMHVKAAGGIRSLDDALAMLAAGADRLGTSSGVAVMEELDRRRKA